MVFGKGWCDDEDLELKRKPYHGDELKIDGFFYGKGVKDFSGEEFHNVICLYENGVLLLAGSPKKGELESYLLKTKDLELLQQTKAAWGLFEVNGDDIKLAYWEAAPCGYPAVLQRGKILNDSTFVLTSERIKRKGKVETRLNINQQYRFQQFEHKPSYENHFLDEY